MFEVLDVVVYSMALHIRSLLHKGERVKPAAPPVRRQQSVQQQSEHIQLHNEVTSSFDSLPNGSRPHTGAKTAWPATWPKTENYDTMREVIPKPFIPIPIEAVDEVRYRYISYIRGQSIADYVINYAVGSWVVTEFWRLKCFMCFVRGMCWCWQTVLYHYCYCTAVDQTEWMLTALLGYCDTLQYISIPQNELLCQSLVTSLTVQMVLPRIKCCGCQYVYRIS